MRLLIHRMPTHEEWRLILEAIGPTAVAPAEALPHYICKMRAMTARLQDCVQKFKLGLGGEPVDKLVIEEVERLRNEQKKTKETKDMKDDPSSLASFPSVDSLAPNPPTLP